MSIELHGVSKAFGPLPVLRDVSLSLPGGELTALLGPSGCGKTNTIPLHVEILYNEYNFVAAFAVASLLALLALVTLVAKSLVEWRTREGRAEGAGRRAAPAAEGQA